MKKVEPRDPQAVACGNYAAAQLGRKWALLSLPVALNEEPLATDLMKGVISPNSILGGDS